MNRTLLLLTLAAVGANAKVGIIPFCSDNGNREPCVPALDGSAEGCPEVALTHAGNFGTEALRSCGIANAAAELTVIGSLSGDAAKNKFFEILCKNELSPGVAPEPKACAVNLANMGRAFHACRCPVSNVICNYISRPLYLELNPLGPKCRGDGLLADTCRAESCATVASDFADSICRDAYACTAEEEDDGEERTPAPTPKRTLAPTPKRTLAPTPKRTLAPTPERRTPSPTEAPESDDDDEDKDETSDPCAGKACGEVCSTGGGSGDMVGADVMSFCNKRGQCVHDPKCGDKDDKDDKDDGKEEDEDEGTGKEVGVRWTYRKTPFRVLAVDPGDAVVFSFTANHDLALFRDEAAFGRCDFDGATTLAGRGASPYEFRGREGRAYYVGCSRGTHCRKSNMKMAIHVGDVPTAPPSAPPTRRPTGYPSRTAFPTPRAVEKTAFPSSMPRTKFPTRRKTAFPTQADKTSFPSFKRTAFPSFKPRKTREPTTYPTAREKTAFPTSRVFEKTRFPSARKTAFPVPKDRRTKFPVSVRTDFPSPARRTAFPSAPPTAYPTRACPAGCVRADPSEDEDEDEDEDGPGRRLRDVGDRRGRLRGGDAVAALRRQVAALQAENAAQCARIEELERAARDATA